MPRCSPARDDPSLIDRTTLLDLPGDPDRRAVVAVLARDVRISEHDGSRVLRAAAGSTGC